MRAIVQTQGRQIIVEENDKVVLNRFPNSQANDEIILDKVLGVGEGEQFQMGQPYLPKVKVKAVILKNARDKKILVIKKKRRKGYERKRGHRQEISLIQIKSIEV